MKRRRRPHPAARSRRFIGWASLGVASTLGAGMAVNAALAPSAVGTSAPSRSSAAAANDTSTKSTTPSSPQARAATPKTTVPKARSKAS